MKTMVKLTVLMAFLLLLTGVAFAGSNCHDYEFDWTDLDNPGMSGTWCVELCFNYGDQSGNFSGFCEADGNLVLFFDAMNKQALFYATSTSIYPNVGYLKFHGDWLHVFTGIMFCDIGYRYEVRGHKVDECTGGM
jgi:hypothetical protein